MTATADASTAAVSHVGLCVTDLDRSLRFYCEGLGFAAAERYQIDATFARALEVGAEAELTSQMIRKEGLALELLHFRQPVPEGTPSSRRNHLGLTHLSFWVADVDELAARLVALGGTVLDGTRVTAGPLDLLFLADPDGVRVELMRRPG